MKKLFVLILVLACVLGLAACKAEKPSEGQPGDNQETIDVMQTDPIETADCDATLKA